VRERQRQPADCASFPVHATLRHGLACHTRAMPCSWQREVNRCHAARACSGECLGPRGNAFDQREDAFDRVRARGGGGVTWGSLSTRVLQAAWTVISSVTLPCRLADEAVRKMPQQVVWGSRQALQGRASQHQGTRGCATCAATHQLLLAVPADPQTCRCRQPGVQG